MTLAERTRNACGRVTIAAAALARAERDVLAGLAAMAREGYSVHTIARDTGLTIQQVRLALRRAARAGLQAWRPGRPRGPRG